MGTLFLTFTCSLVCFLLVDRVVSVNPVNVLVAFRAHFHLTRVFTGVDNIAFDVASSTNFSHQEI